MRLAKTVARSRLMASTSTETTRREGLASQTMLPETTCRQSGRGSLDRAIGRHGLQLSIFLGGVVGALSRAGLLQLFPVDGRTWPWPTFIANVAGTVLLGFLTTRLQERLPPSTYRRPLLGTGFCGALTTFSTFQLELVKLVRNGHAPLAVGYLVAGVATGLAGVYMATALTRRGRLR